MFGNHLLRSGGSVRGSTPARPMSTNATDDTADARTEEPEQRYAEMNIGDDEFVIYDRENHQAWIQSSMALDTASLR